MAFLAVVFLNHLSMEKTTENPSDIHRGVKEPTKRLTPSPQREKAKTNNKAINQVVILKLLLFLLGFFTELLCSELLCDPEHCLEEYVGRLCVGSFAFSD